MYLLVASAAAGSPPRVWGAWETHKVSECSNRFTPTRVGSMALRDSASPGLSVHPHACGEHRRRCHERGTINGSPPRVWGASPDGQSVDVTERFTPTRVGSMRCRMIERSSPRGSPPRVWGACGSLEGVLATLPVHPHACGEHPPMPRRRSPTATVHPHACGEHQPAAPTRLLQTRFTPTRVGSILKNYPFRGILAKMTPSMSIISRLGSPNVLTANPCSVFWE